MDTTALFSMALQLGQTPWRVKGAEFSGEPKTLEIKLGFERGSRFACPECGTECSVHDTKEKRWRHLNFFQYRCELVAPTPRVKCAEHGIRVAEVPWGKKGSGFTLMMEAFVALLCQQMPVVEVAELLDEHDSLLWRLINRLVQQAHGSESWAGLRRVLVDETSSKRGHRYVTNFVDAETNKLLYMAQGKGSETISEFAQELASHGARAEQIELVCMDMSPAFEKGVRELFPEAKIVYDHFHIMQMAGKAVDEVRKSLQREGADLKGAMWAVRGNQWSQSEERMAEREAYCRQYPRLGRAVMLREALQDVLKEEDVEALKWWCQWAMRSRLEPFKKLARSIRRRWDGVTAFMETRVTNGLMEAINGKLQLAKRLARGYRSFKNFQTMAYLKAGRLDLQLPPLQPVKTHSI